MCGSRCGKRRTWLRTSGHMLRRRDGGFGVSDRLSINRLSRVSRPYRRAAVRELSRRTHDRDRFPDRRAYRALTSASERARARPSAAARTRPPSTNGQISRTDRFCDLARIYLKRICLKPIPRHAETMKSVSSPSDLDLRAIVPGDYSNRLRSKTGVRSLVSKRDYVMVRLYVQFFCVFLGGSNFIL